MADSVLFTCWPPAPEARKVSMRRSAGSRWNSASSTWGSTATVRWRCGCGRRTRSPAPAAPGGPRSQISGGRRLRGRDRQNTASLTPPAPSRWCWRSGQFQPLGGGAWHTSGTGSEQTGPPPLPRRRPGSPHDHVLLVAGILGATAALQLFPSSCPPPGFSGGRTPPGPAPAPSWSGSWSSSWASSSSAWDWVRLRQQVTTGSSSCCSRLSRATRSGSP